MPDDKPHHARATRGPDGQIDFLTYRIATPHGVDENVNLQGEAARKAVEELRTQGIVIHVDDGSCIKP